METNQSKGARWANWIWILVLTVWLEIITLWIRFGLGLESSRDGLMRRMRIPLRIHHGYVGLLLLGWAAWTPLPRWARTWAIRIGAALFFSDLAHHFLVLWPLTGDPQFDLVPDFDREPVPILPP
jgi:hypothetical protein